jgi:hypothetical protein
MQNLPFILTIRQLEPGLFQIMDHGKQKGQTDNKLQEEQSEKI